ncbi:MAG: histidine phosphatase family protein [Muribaculaceae bacterium]|nr:histidine phosphatase family protein [Muribaculaceae bacterium]
MFKRITILLTLAAASILTSPAADPTATRYSWAQCAGSLMPYPAREQLTLPDSLTAVYIDHVGRHGARFPASPKYTMTMKETLMRADSLGTITTAGHRLLKLCNDVIELSHNNWGALDSLGKSEQRDIASRMFLNFPNLFRDTRISAISSYAPRCVMSMYEFTHQLDRLNNNIEITTNAGRVNSPLLRPFDTDTEYIEWRKEDAQKPVYDSYIETFIPAEPLKRVLGAAYPFPEDWRQLALCEYYVLAGMSAMGRPVDPSYYFTLDEYNALWSCFNLRQYLVRTATTLSTVPADITSPLVLDIIESLQRAAEGKNNVTANLRFGHAETLMPLLSQLHIPGCYYMTNYFDTVRQHWKDFYVVPMAANIQFVLLKSESGKHYVMTLLNEEPVNLIPNDNRTLLPVSEAIKYMTHCLPLHLQP